jgi:uncharacterized protein YkwD
VTSRPFACTQTVAWFALLLLSATACASRGPKPQVWRAPGARAATYEASGPGEPAFVERTRSDALRAAVESSARAQGAPLTGDGRLGHLAVYAAENAERGRLPPRLVEELARHLGVFDPSVEVIVLEVPSEAPAAPLMAAIERARDGHEFTHFGAALHSANGRTWLALALSERRLELEPVPSVVEVNTPLRLRGRLPDGYGQPRVDVVADAAPRAVLPAGPEREFNIQIPTSQVGVYRITVLGEGPTGTAVLAKLPIYVGTDAPLEFEQYPRESAHDLATLRAELVREIQMQRRAAGLPELVLHPTLDTIASQHSVDMRDYGFVSHQSVRTGSPAERVERAGLFSSFVLENIARGADVASLRPLPNSREQQNVLHRSITHLGVGVVEASDANAPLLIATSLFAQLGAELDPSLAEPSLLSQINAARSRRGQRTLALDPALSDVARAAARNYFADPAATEQGVVDAANAELASFSFVYARVNAVLAVTRELEPVATLEPFLDASARNVGIGVARGQRGDGAPALAVMVVVALPRSE